ncbi:hypothetical protein QJS04_geneDACA011420 [Acorus gramineus]|uniref:Uncharacterized protein n=1 Tax=Acorus gramineus TaxID=55184 RepID=A0AAV9AL02_ACOGR|nr:hypothetical protein QJS04_geneDACA011420 [Acorus gramineus]
MARTISPNTFRSTTSRRTSMLSGAMAGGFSGSVASFRTSCRTFSARMGNGSCLKTRGGR